MITLKDQGRPLVHFWSGCVGAGRANEGLRADWQQQLRLVKEKCGFRYIRFHGLLHDDMFVLIPDANGTPRLNFQYVDALFDALLEMDVRPIVEFGFMPSCLRSDETTQFWWKGNISPARDESLWVYMIDGLVRHWISRYGLDEVRCWYFEVWNEPNLPVFWSGTRSQYFAMYACTARAIKAIDVQLRVGGPATSNYVPDSRFDGEREDVSAQLTHKVEDLDSLQWHGVWVEAFLQFCAENHLPVDFVSAHPYPTDFAVDREGQSAGRSRKLHSTRDDLRWIREVVAKSAYPEAEIHLTEWSSSPSSRDCAHDMLPEATYIIESCISSSGMVDSLSYWTFTDIFEELGGAPSVFHGGFGMVNYQGVVKPSFHGYRMLNELGETELARGDGYIVTRDGEGKLRALLWNYPDEVRTALPMSAYPDRSVAEKTADTGSDRRISFRVEGVSGVIRRETLDREHGSAYDAWQRMGMPEPPTREQAAQLKAEAQALKVEEFTVDGALQVDMALPAWHVVALRQL